MKKKIECIDKAKFIEIRYERFQQKREKFKECGLIEERSEKGMHYEYSLPFLDGAIVNPPYDEELITKKTVGMMLNLDEPCRDAMKGLYKEMVLCDMCNRHIYEATFIRVEGSQVYHESCVREHFPHYDIQNAINATHEDIYEEMAKEGDVDVNKTISLVKERIKRLKK